MAMAKQQQFYAEQQLQQQLILAQSKRKPGSLVSGDAGSVVSGSQQLQAAGAMVLHQPHRNHGTPERKLL
jgi:hypothetical protein